MSKPIDFDAAIRKNAALEMAHQRATTQAQAAELRAKDATIAALRAALQEAKDALTIAHTTQANLHRYINDRRAEYADSAPRKETP